MICCDEGGGQATMNWEEWLNDDDEEIEIAYITKEVTCGYKCCNRAYEITVSGSMDTWEPHITSVQTESVSGCESAQTFYDCVTGDPVPCTGDCE